MSENLNRRLSWTSHLRAIELGAKPKIASILVPDVPIKTHVYSPQVSPLVLEHFIIPFPQFCGVLTEVSLALRCNGHASGILPKKSGTLNMKVLVSHSAFNKPAPLSSVLCIELCIRFTQGSQANFKKCKFKNLCTNLYIECYAESAFFHSIDNGVW